MIRSTRSWNVVLQLLLGTLLAGFLRSKDLGRLRDESPMLFSHFDLYVSFGSLGPPNFPGLDNNGVMRLIHGRLPCLSSLTQSFIR